MKKLYIAPEVEILCFAPMEALANDLEWTTWGARSGDEDNSESIEILETTPEEDGEG